MRILICAAEAPVPPVNGFRLQLIHLCRQLGSRHEVVVLSYGSPGQQAAAPEGIELILLPPPTRSRIRRAATTARGIAARRPRRTQTLAPPMEAPLRRLLGARQFDVAHVTGSALAAVGHHLGDTPAVLAALDAWHLNIAASINIAGAHRRPLLRLEQRKVERYGASAYRSFERVTVVSEEDAAALLSLDPTLSVEVVPNGVDAEYFAPAPAEPRDEHLVVFTGTMGWPPNVEAARFLARDVLPVLRALEPRARLALVGRDPAPLVRALGAIEGVEVTGEVPDVRPWLHRAAAFACPMISGTGIKNKLLEALACGTPSVATSLSCQGISVVPGRDLLVADSAPDLAASLHRLLSGGQLRESLGLRAREAIVAAHGWNSVARSYERIYGEISAGAAG